MVEWIPNTAIPDDSDRGWQKKRIAFFVFGLGQAYAWIESANTLRKFLGEMKVGEVGDRQ